MQFSAIPLFQNISEENCLAMMKCFNVQQKSYRAGQIAYTYGESGDCVGIVAEGEAFIERIDVNGYRTILERLPENSVFGSMLAFSSGGDCVSVVCRKASTIIYIDYLHLTGRCPKACAHHSELVRNMFALMTEKASDLAGRIEVISHRNLRDKLMCCFRQFACGGEDAVLPFNFSQLADYVCADRSAMMRELGKMKEDGIITISKRTIHLL